VILFRKILVLSFLMLGFSTPAFALFVEPYAGYEMGNAESGSTANDASGINLGLRLGGESASLFYGVEYALANIDVDNTNGNDDEIKTSDLGLFLGSKFSTVRLWFTFWLDSEGASDNAGGSYEGMGGYKLGLGFALFGTANLNIEKTLRTWTKYEGNDLNNDYEIDAFMISISMPITF
jgi:hypothetical protein